jgi:formate dehydrogenase subunit delta
MMANDIGAYFAGYADQSEAVEEIANHLRNFWEARMRREIVDYLQNGGNELNPLVREAVSFIATESVPSSEEVGEG